MSIPLAYWNQRFNALIPLITIDATLPCWDHTIALTGIDPYRIITHWPTQLQTHTSPPHNTSSTHSPPPAHSSPPAGAKAKPKMVTATASSAP